MFPIKDSIRIPFAPVVTYGLILVNALVFLYQASLSSQDATVFSYTHALVPCRYFNPTCAAELELDPHDYLPFIEGAFMHGGWWHLILNMWTLFIFGASLEGRIGRAQFLSFYLVCGLAASAAHAYFNQDSTVPALGASGAIAGVLGAYADHFSPGEAHHPDPDCHHSVLLQGARLGLRADLVRLSVRTRVHRPCFADRRPRHCMVGSHRRICGGHPSHPAVALRAGSHLRRVPV